MSRAKKVLAAAIAHVRHTLVLGTTNKAKDLYATNNWVLFPQFRYHCPGRYVSKENEKKENEWSFLSDDSQSTMTMDLTYTTKHPGQDPLEDPQFCLTTRRKEMLLIALLAGEKRVGNCQVRCCLLAKYLWELKDPSIRRIEILSFNFDHLVVVVNRGGLIKDPLSWGAALIVESWYPEKGAIYTPEKFVQQAEKTRLFIKGECFGLHGLGISGKMKLLSQTNWKSPVSWERYVEIIPEKHLYPTYSQHPFYPIEYYYEPAYTYTTEITESSKDKHNHLKEDRLTHQEKFKYCLEELPKEETSIEDKTMALF
jgi:hypothetical protein